MEELLVPSLSNRKQEASWLSLEMRVSGQMTLQLATP